MSVRVIVYGRLGCPSCHRALEVLRDADILCETVDVARCRHCWDEMCARLRLVSAVALLGGGQQPRARLHMKGLIFSQKRKKKQCPKILHPRLLRMKP